MGNWFPKKGRGLIFGLWTCHQYIGDIISAVATAIIVGCGLSWQWALIVPGVANGVWGVINFYFLPNTPQEVRASRASRMPQRAPARLAPARRSSPKPLTALRRLDLTWS